MKILIITPDIYPIEMGYGSRNSLILSKAFEKFGHEVDILASCPDYKKKWNL